jgi:hypothetical protein
MTTYDPFNPGEADLEAPPVLPNGHGDQAVGVDDAPYGINPNTGKPYTMSAEKRAEMGERLAAGRRRKASTRPPSRQPSRASSARPKSPKPPPGPTYAGTVQGGLMLVAGILGMAPALRLDAAAIALHSEPIALAVQDVALEDQRVAALIDRLSKVTPYGALGAALIGLGLQVAANHRMVPILPQFGILSPDELLPPEENDGPPGSD